VHFVYRDGSVVKEWPRPPAPRGAHTRSPVPIQAPKGRRPAPGLSAALSVPPEVAVIFLNTVQTNAIATTKTSGTDRSWMRRTFRVMLKGLLRWSP
jgi:hypothetical protein